MTAYYETTALVAIQVPCCGPSLLLDPELKAPNDQKGASYCVYPNYVSLVLVLGLVYKVSWLYDQVYYSSIAFLATLLNLNSFYYFQHTTFAYL